jgi:hypothetical protein
MTTHFDSDLARIVKNDGSPVRTARPPTNSPGVAKKREICNFECEV